MVKAFQCMVVALLATLSVECQAELPNKVTICSVHTTAIRYQNEPTVWIKIDFTYRTVVTDRSADLSPQEPSIVVASPVYLYGLEEGSTWHPVDMLSPNRFRETNGQVYAASLVGSFQSTTVWNQWWLILTLPLSDFSFAGGCLSPTQINELFDMPSWVPDEFWETH